VLFVTKLITATRISGNSRVTVDAKMCEPELVFVPCSVSLCDLWEGTTFLLETAGQTVIPWASRNHLECRRAAKLPANLKLQPQLFVYSGVPSKKGPGITVCVACVCLLFV
jgi:hypothetical protein